MTTHAPDAALAQAMLAATAWPTGLRVTTQDVWDVAAPPAVGLVVTATRRMATERLGAWQVWAQAHVFAASPQDARSIAGTVASVIDTLRRVDTPFGVVATASTTGVQPLPSTDADDRTAAGERICRQLITFAAVTHG